MAETNSVEVGMRVRDRITGFSGIVTSVTDWLNGCRRVGVQPEELAEGKVVEYQVFDEPQLEVVDAVTAHTRIKESVNPRTKQPYRGGDQPANAQAAQPR